MKQCFGGTWFRSFEQICFWCFGGSFLFVSDLHSFWVVKLLNSSWTDVVCVLMFSGEFGGWALYSMGLGVDDFHKIQMLCTFKV